MTYFIITVLDCISIFFIYLFIISIFFYPAPPPTNCMACQLAYYECNNKLIINKSLVQYINHICLNHDYHFFFSFVYYNYIGIHMHAHACTHARTHARTDRHTYKNIVRVCAFPCTFGYMQIKHIHAHKHTHTRTHALTRIYAATRQHSRVRACTKNACTYTGIRACIHDCERIGT
jgi:hypothetical protein